MSDFGTRPNDPNDLDDELVRFTDDLLDGQIELEEARNNLSEDEDLRELQDLVLRMHRAFGPEELSPAKSSRMKMALVTELRKMNYSAADEKSESLLDRIRRMLAGIGGGRSALMPLAALAAVFLFVFVFLVSDLNLGQLLQGTLLDPPSAYPITGQILEVDEVYGLTSRVSVSSNGTEVDNDSWYSAISADGRFTAFVSASDDLVDNDNNGLRDVFVHDQNTGYTERVSVSTAGVEGNGDSVNPVISADGRFVAFESQANNLAAGDGNGARDIFFHDRQTGTTELISVVNGQSASGDSRHPSMSDDGRFITFYSYAADLASNDGNGVADVFLYDRQSGTMTALSLTSGGQVGGGESRNPTISGDGQVVAFESMANDLAANDNNSYSDIFLYNRQSGSLVRIVSGDGEEGDGHSYNPDLSIDGSFVAFQSKAENFWSGDSNGKSDIFVYFMNGNQAQIERASVARDDAQANDDSSYPSISADGRFVAFSSFASNLAGGEIYGSNIDVFLYDRQVNLTERISADSLGQEPDGASVNPYISADGRFISFDSTGTNLVDDDSNNRVDVFVRDRMPPVGVSLNYLTGSPGSFFTVSGSYFTPNSNVSLVVNGVDLGTVSSDSNGDFTAVLATDTADPGAYIVTGSAGMLTGSVGFVLDDDGTLRLQESQAAVFNVPADIAYTFFNHLPAAIGN